MLTPYAWTVPGGVNNHIAALAELKSRIETMSAELLGYEAKADDMLWNAPNILDKSVPVGNPPEANKILRTWGEIRNEGVPNHEEILTKLGLLDMERAAKTTGTRFYFLRGDLVLLEQSLLRYALDKLAKKGYTPILPPFMLRKKYFRGAAPLSVFEDAL